MVKVFFSQQGESKTICNLPVGENPTQLEITDEEYVKTSTHDFDLVNGKLKFTEKVKPIDEKAVAKEALKTKLEAGTASDEDVKSALKLLL